MKKLLLATAVAAAIPCAASAQSTTNVTLFGLMDMGINRVDLGPGASSMRVDSGMLSTGRWGLRGSEDLGGGLSAIFHMEGEVQGDTGNGANGGAFTFNRRVFTGLKGGFGEIYAGRDYTPAYWADIAADITSYGLYGSSRVFQAASGLTNRFSNGLFWNSPVWSGFSLKAAWSTGEQIAEPKDRGNAWGLGAFYNSGPLLITAHYQSVKNTATPVVEAKEIGIGGGYTIGPVRLRAGWGKSDPEGNSNNLSQVHLGAAYAIGVGEVYVQGQQIKREAATGTEPKATVFGFGYTHPLSKRTTLYASYGQTKNNATGNFSLVNSANAYAPTAAGESPKGIALGIRHQF